MPYQGGGIDVEQADRTTRHGFTTADEVKLIDREIAELRRVKRRILRDVERSQPD